jgi:hypothetical protein
MTGSNVSLACKNARLTFAPLAGHAGYGYQLSVRSGDGWREVSAPGNPLVRGASIGLYPNSISALGEDALCVSGVRMVQTTGGSLVPMPWQGTIRAEEALGWFQVDLEVDSPAEITLTMAGEFEPEITIDLGQLPPYERGDHVWFKTGITNPTKWNDEAYGNDFPATYYFDPYLHFELLMFFDMTAMDWMGFDNIARFLNYRCGFRRRYQPAPSAEVGLYADGYSGKVFPAGKQRFVYWLSACERMAGPSAPTEQQALVELVNGCLDLLPQQAGWPEKATTWSDFSLNCARDMADSQHSWGADERGEFILNYVDGYTPAWDAVAKARGRKQQSRLTPCFESAVWAAHPLFTVCAVDPSPEYRELQERLLAFIQRQVQGGLGLLSGKAEAFALGGTWQYVDILEELWQVARFQKDAALQAKIETEVEGVLIPLARSVGHLFPLCFDKSTLRKTGPGDGHPIAGTYAWFMLELYQATAKEHYLAEARQALIINANLPVNTVLQEVFLTAMGAQAASKMYEMTGEEEFAKIYRYLLAQTFRLMYWFSDRTYPEARDVNILGMFHACTPIIYTAFFENIETLARIVPTFRVHGASQGVLNAINHARKNNFYCFPQCLPEKYHTSPLMYIPRENIPLLEGPRDYDVGQEIYGAGWAFRAYLLWEALARCEDRDIMVMNLNGFEERERLDSPTQEWDFLVYHPEAEPRRAVLTFPVADGCQASIVTGSEPKPAGQPAPLVDGKYALALQPYEQVYLHITVSRKGAGAGS